MKREVKLSEIVEIVGRVGWKGYTVNDLREDGPWVIGANDITPDNRLDLTKAKHISREKYEESPEIMIETNDILIVKVGSTIGKVAIVNRNIGEACINPNSVLLKQCKINPSYLYYFLISPKGQAFLRNNSSASAQSALNQMTLKEMIIDLVNETDQENIASILNSLNLKIYLNNRINSELESMAKTIYDYWFIQFDFPTPAEYAAAVGKPEMAGKPYKSSGGKMVWNKELKREIPVGWKTSHLKEFALTASGGTPLSTNKEYYEDGNIPWINSGELNESYILNTNNFITKKGLNNSSAKIFPEQTLLVALYGATAGKVSLLMIPACTNQAICAIIPINKIFTLFLKFAISGMYKYLVNLSTGSARDNLSQDVLKELKFIIPSNNLLNPFNERIDPIMGKISTNIKENQQLSTLRDWLLPMLMNGQVKVI